MKVLVSRHDVEDLLCKAVEVVDNSDLLSVTELHPQGNVYIPHAEAVRMIICAAVDYVFQYGLVGRKHSGIYQALVRYYNLDDLVHELTGLVYGIEDIHECHGYARDLQIRGKDLFIIWSKM